MTDNKLDGILDFFPDRNMNEGLWQVLIAVCTIIPIGLSLLCLYNNVNYIYPVLLIIPVILVSYQYPDKGIRFALLISAYHIISVILFNPDIISFSGAGMSSASVVGGGNAAGILAGPDIIYLGSALAYSVLYILISAIISALSKGLVRQEQRYQITFNSNDTGVVVLNLRDMTIAEANGRAASILGYNHENLIGMHLESFWPEIDAEELTSEIDEIGTINPLEARFVLKKNKEIQVHIADAHLPGDGLALTISDITKEKEQEKQLEESRRRIATLISNIPGMAYRYDNTEKGWRISFVSDGVYELTGYSPSELKSKPMDSFLNLIYPEDRENYLNEFYKGLSEERHYRQVYRISTAGGEERWLWEQGRGVMNDDNCVSVVEGFITDITEEIRSKEEVIKQNRQLSAINKIISISDISSSTEELIDMCLEEICKQLQVVSGSVYLTGEGRDQAVLKGSRGEIKTGFGENFDTESQAYRRVFEEGQIWYEETENSAVMTDDSYTTFMIPLCAGENIIGSMVLSVAGVSSRLPDEREHLETIGKEVANAIHKAELRRQLKEAYEEVNLYLDIMSHDINNTNMISIGYLEVLEGMLDTPDYQEMVEIALNSTRKSAEIIENVNTIRQINSKNSDLEEVDLDRIVEKEIEIFRDAHIAYEPSGIRVMANELLSEVFTNLIGNSIKYGGDNVHITVAAEDRGDSVDITIADDGPGIPDDLKPVIFSRFQRGRTNTSGKGLGLFITKMLIDRYGGTITVEDRIKGVVDEGAMIRFTLKKYSE